MRLAEPGHDVLLATAQGFSIRFPESDVRPMGRATRGVRGISLRKNDRVVAMEPLDPLGGPVLSVTAKGYGKRTEVGEYRQQGRGGKGSSRPPAAKTGDVIAVKRSPRRRPRAITQYGDPAHSGGRRTADRARRQGVSSLTLR